MASQTQGGKITSDLVFLLHSKKLCPIFYTSEQQGHLFKQKETGRRTPIFFFPPWSAAFAN